MGSPLGTALMRMPIVHLDTTFHFSREGPIFRHFEPGHECTTFPSQAAVYASGLFCKDPFLSQYEILML